MSEDRKHLAKMFHKKFEAIPDEKWCTGVQVAADGRRCALGHVSELPANHGVLTSTPATQQLQSLFPWRERGRDNWGLEGDVRFCVASINNGGCPDYQQETPKARVLAALEDIIRQ
jgi:hypothetical protein